MVHSSSADYLAVWEGKKASTKGGLTKKDLMLNKKGKIVSRRKHNIAIKLGLGKNLQNYKKKKTRRTPRRRRSSRRRSSRHKSPRRRSLRRRSSRSKSPRRTSRRTKKSAALRKRRLVASCVSKNGRTRRHTRGRNCPPGFKKKLTTRSLSRRRVLKKSQYKNA